MDCVPREEGGENGLEVGERYVTDVPLGCKTLAKGVPNSMAPLIAISCPEYVCRGERACRYGDAKVWCCCCCCCCCCCRWLSDDDIVGGLMAMMVMLLLVVVVIVVLLQRNTYFN